MIPVDIKTIPGYLEVSDLVPDGHLLNYKQVWSLDFTHYLDEAGDLYNKLILELTTDRDAYDIPTIKLVIDRPREMKLFPNLDIIQLSIDDYKGDEWGDGNYYIYDAEMDTDWEMYCFGITFSRGRQIPNFK